MLNLCHFSIITTHPAFGQALVFKPILEEGSGPYPVLKDFTLPSGVPDIAPGTHVIVPRFAPAVAWAFDCGLIPYCVPLSGQRQEDGSFVCAALEHAPDGLVLEFGGEMLPIPAAHSIARAVTGPFTVQVAGGPDLPPVPGEQTAYRRDDGTIHVPELDTAPDAILVPQDGAIIKAVADAFPTSALLVTDVLRPGQRTRLFQVR